MNKRESKRFRVMLEAEREKILKAARETTHERRGTDVDDLKDDLDLASSELDTSMVYKFRDRERNLLKKIEKALDKINNGNYGVCESCEENIRVKRLEVRPVTEMCISCKEEEELREK